MLHLRRYFLPPLLLLAATRPPSRAAEDEPHGGEVAEPSAQAGALSTRLQLLPASTASSPAGHGRPAAPPGEEQPAEHDGGASRTSLLDIWPQITDTEEHSRRNARRPYGTHPSKDRMYHHYQGPHSRHTSRDEMCHHHHHHPQRPDTMYTSDNEVRHYPSLQCCHRSGMATCRHGHSKGSRSWCDGTWQDRHQGCRRPDSTAAAYEAGYFHGTDARRRDTLSTGAGVGRGGQGSVPSSWSGLQHPQVRPGEDLSGYVAGCPNLVTLDPMTEAYMQGYVTGTAGLPLQPGGPATSHDSDSGHHDGHGGTKRSQHRQPDGRSHHSHAPRQLPQPTVASGVPETHRQSHQGDRLPAATSGVQTALYVIESASDGYETRYYPASWWVCVASPDGAASTCVGAEPLCLDRLERYITGENERGVMLHAATPLILLMPAGRPAAAALCRSFAAPPPPPPPALTNDIYLLERPDTRLHARVTGRHVPRLQDDHEWRARGERLRRMLLRDGAEFDGSQVLGFIYPPPDGRREVAIIQQERQTRGGTAA